MSQSRPQRQNGNGQQGNNHGARNELQLKDNIVSGATGTPILEHVNLGQGNYAESDYWQQIRSYRRGLYVYTAYNSMITGRAIRETKYRLGKEGYNAVYDETAADVEVMEPADPVPLDELDVDEITPEDSRRRQIMKRGEAIWEKLGEPDEVLSHAQAAAMMEKTGVGMDWMPISWKMVVGRHEASRSRDAELLRDVFTSVQDLRASGSNGQELQQLMGNR